MVERFEESAAVRKSTMPLSSSAKSQCVVNTELLHVACTARRVSPAQGAPPNTSSEEVMVHEGLPTHADSTTAFAPAASQRGSAFSGVWPA